LKVFASFPRKRKTFFLERKKQKTFLSKSWLIGVLAVPLFVARPRRQVRLPWVAGKGSGLPKIRANLENSLITGDESLTPVRRLVSNEPYFICRLNRLFPYGARELFLNRRGRLRIKPRLVSDSSRSVHQIGG
jgi:hypothetical protein